MTEPSAARPPPLAAPLTPPVPALPLVPGVARGAIRRRKQDLQVQTAAQGTVRGAEHFSQQTAEGGAGVVALNLSDQGIDPGRGGGYAHEHHRHSACDHERQCRHGARRQSIDGRFDGVQYQFGSHGTQGFFCFGHSDGSVYVPDAVQLIHHFRQLELRVQHRRVVRFP